MAWARLPDWWAMMPSRWWASALPARPRAPGGSGIRPRPVCRPGGAVRPGPAVGPASPAGRAGAFQPGEPGVDDRRRVARPRLAGFAERRQLAPSPPAILARSAAAARAILSQPCPSRWRKRRIVGYQGLSSRPRNQRQSDTQGVISHTGLARAPARCATAESTVITRSSALMAAAVAAKPTRSGEMSVMANSGWSLRSAARGPTCRLVDRTPLGVASSGFSWLSAIERRASLVCSGLPPQARPTLNPGPARRLAHCAASAGSARR